MKNYTFDETKKIYDDAKGRGLDAKKVMSILVSQGNTFEGVDMDAAKQEAVKYVPSMQKQEAPAEPSLTDKVGEDISQRADKVGDILNRKDTGIVEKSVQVFGQGAGMAANALEQTAMEIPGVKQAAGVMGAGIKWLTETPLIKGVGSLIGDNKKLQEVVGLYDTDPNFKDSVDAVANIVRLGGDVDMAMQAAKFTENVLGKLKNTEGQQKVLQGEVLPAELTPEQEAANILKETPTKTPVKPILDIKGLKEGKPAEIMNKVARLNPSKVTKFRNMSGGQTPGEYLVKRGIFGDEPTVIEKLTDNFMNNKARVDTEIGKLPGTYEPKMVKTMLKEMLDRETAISSEGAISPRLGKVQSLLKKSGNQGWTMKEINEVKRLYEKTSTLDYFKTISSNVGPAEKAKLLDSSLRDWQVKQATTLGFKNLAELNKETQLARQLADSLGEKYNSQVGNNMTSLTDYIVLSGGDAKSILGLITKKTFGSKALQAKLAKLLNKGNPVEGEIMPDIGPSQVPQLPAPKKGAPQSSNYVPIEVKGAATVEKPANYIRKNVPENVPLLNKPGQNPIQLGSETPKISNSTKQLTPKTVVKSYKDIISQNYKSGAHINVGMNIGDGTLKLTTKEIKDTLKRFGVDIKSGKVVQSGTEPTYSITLSKGLNESQMNELSIALKQDAIPQIVNGKGGLYGPKAADWGGEFNPGYFLGKNGKSILKSKSELNLEVKNPVILKTTKGNVTREYRLNDFADEKGYVYHTTSLKKVDDISSNGLIPNKGIHGNAVYFAPDEASTIGQASYEGATLRVNIKKLNTKNIASADVSGFGDPTELVYDKNIPPEAIEIKISGNKWKNLTDVYKKYNFKNIPNKQGGFINLSEIAKSIDSTDKNIMIQFSDAVLSKTGKLSKQLQLKAQDLANAMNMQSATATNRKLAEDFSAILDIQRGNLKKKMK